MNSQQSWFTNQNPAGSCSLNPSGSSLNCSAGYLEVEANLDGRVFARDGWYCVIYDYGDSFCGND